MSLPLIFLVFVLIIGFAFGIFVFLDILTYLDLQRRLKRERGAEK